MKLPAELSPRQVMAIVDTREQAPWDLAPLGMSPGTLDTGDYSIVGLEHVVRLERKSLSDLLGCVGTERERFDREVQRLLSYPTRAIIVEATWADMERGEWRSKITPQAAIGSVLGWIAAGVPVVLAGDRQHAQTYAARLLFITARRRWRELRTLAAGLNTEIVA